MQILYEFYATGEGMLYKDAGVMRRCRYLLKFSQGVRTQNSQGRDGGYATGAN